MRIRMMQDGTGFPLGLPLLLLLLAMTLAGCTGNGGGDVATLADSASGERNAPVAAVEADPAENGADAGLDGATTEPGTEAETANSGDSANGLESTEGPASRTADTAGEVGSDAGADTATAVEDSEEPLPFLIDLGANKCIPCKMMAPILEELAETKSDYFEVIFYDVWEDRSKGQEFGIRAIPTQIFYSARGEELFRHEGFYSRAQILKKWRDLGVDVGE